VEKVICLVAWVLISVKLFDVGVIKALFWNVGSLVAVCDVTLISVWGDFIALGIFNSCILFHQFLERRASYFSRSLWYPNNLSRRLMLNHTA